MASTILPKVFKPVSTDSESITNKIMVSKEYEKIEVLIPKDYFDNNIAMYMGEKINTLGIINIIAYPKKKGAKTEYYQLSIPAKIAINFNEELVAQTYEVDGREILFMKGQLESGDIFLDSDKHVQSLFNSIDFLNWFNGAKISDTVPYDNVVETFMESASMNGIGLGVPQVLVEAMLSEMCRDMDDISVPYRIKMNKTGKNDNSYKFIPIKEIPRTSSVLASLAFEDMKKAQVASIIQTEKNVDQRISPIEELLKT